MAPVLESLLNKVAGFQACTFTTLLKRFQHRCFPVKFEKFLETPILKNICERLCVVAKKCKIRSKAKILTKLQK